MGGLNDLPSEIIYRGYRITYRPKPIPLRRFDYDFEHLDYNGPDDDRVGSAGSVAECKRRIDRIEEGEE